MSANLARFILLTSCLVGARNRQPTATDATPRVSGSSAPVPEHAAWLLDGGADDRFVRVAKHLRGFDVAMVETGYRDGELYWAGKDANWEYAAYQVEKIETAVANGTERRPKRAASARMLEGALVAVKDAIGGRDAGGFDTAFTTLTATYNLCHVAERVPFVHIVLSSRRARLRGRSRRSTPLARDARSARLADRRCVPRRLWRRAGRTRADVQLRGISGHHHREQVDRLRADVVGDGLEPPSITALFTVGAPGGPSLDLNGDTDVDLHVTGVAATGLTWTVSDVAL